MTRRSTRAPGSRRATHSLDQIVATAIAILDRGGIRGLTLRALAAELGGGLGSVYWYVDGKDEVLALACNALLGEALEQADAGRPAAGGPVSPELATNDPAIAAALAELRGTALALFEQTRLHPWLALQQHAQGAGTTNSRRSWERLGRSLAVMGLGARQQLNGVAAISGYVTGVAAELAAQDARAGADREGQLDELVSGLLGTDPVEYAWNHSMAEELRHPDEQEQFAAGLDLLLGGLLRQALARRDAA